MWKGRRGVNNVKTNFSQFRVYATPDRIDQVDYALEVGTAILEFFEDYFDVPYPLPKQGRCTCTYYQYNVACLILASLGKNGSVIGQLLVTQTANHVLVSL